MEIRSNFRRVASLSSHFLFLLLSPKRNVFDHGPNRYSSTDSIASSYLRNFHFNLQSLGPYTFQRVSLWEMAILFENEKK